MMGINEPSGSKIPVPVPTLRRPKAAIILSKAQPLFLILFIGSTIALLVMWLVWRETGHGPITETPFELSLAPSQAFWLIVAAATSLASLLGIISNTILGWRREQREARAEALNRRRQELEIQKLQLELEREKALEGPPSPVPGERHRLESQWAELDRRYQGLTRRLAAVDKDLGRALDSERRLVLQEHRDDLAAQRDEVAASMSQLEQRLSELQRLN